MDEKILAALSVKLDTILDVQMSTLTVLARSLLKKEQAEKIISENKSHIMMKSGLIDDILQGKYNEE